MPTQFHPTLYKVVTGATRSRYGTTSNPLTSALVRTEATGRRTRVAGVGLDYQPTMVQNIFIAPKVSDTPILLFSDLALAYDFADRHDGKLVYAAEGVGELVPVARVLALKSGWSRSLVPFWNAVRAGDDVSKYSKSRTAPAGTMALFGYIRLTALATRPEAEVVAPLGAGLAESVDGGPNDSAEDAAPSA